MLFSGVTKNLNLKISTKNLVAFKRWDGVKDEKFNIIRVHWKIQFLEGALKTNILAGEFPKKGGLVKKDGVDVFEVRLRPQCTLWVGGSFLLTQISKANS